MEIFRTKLQFHMENTTECRDIQFKLFLRRSDLEISRRVSLDLQT
jgi:hypothetical protein